MRTNDTVNVLIDFFGVVFVVSTSFLLAWSWWFILP